MTVPPLKRSAERECTRPFAAAAYVPDESAPAAVGGRLRPGSAEDDRERRHWELRGARRPAGTNHPEVPHRLKFYRTQYLRWSSSASLFWGKQLTFPLQKLIYSAVKDVLIL